MKSLLLIAALFPFAKCPADKPVLVYIRPRYVSPDVADKPVQLCAYVITGDSVVRVGIDPRDADSVAHKEYCGRERLTAFKAEPAFHGMLK